MNKYKLTGNTRIHKGTTLFQIEALKDFGDVKKGQLGGFVQSESNLSQAGNCWIFNSAIVRDNARVSDDDWVDGYSEVSANAEAKDMKHKPKFFGEAEIGDKAWITWIFIPFVTMLVSAIVFGFMVIERFDEMLLSMSGSYY